MFPVNTVRAVVGPARTGGDNQRVKPGVFQIPQTPFKRRLLAPPAISIPQDDLPLYQRRPDAAFTRGNLFHMDYRAQMPQPGERPQGVTNRSLLADEVASVWAGEEAFHRVDEPPVFSHVWLICR